MNAHPEMNYPAIVQILRSVKFHRSELVVWENAQRTMQILHKSAN